MPDVVSAVAETVLPVEPLSVMALVLLLAHMPPDVASDKVTGLPGITLDGPEMAVIAGVAFTVTVAVV